jgi:WHG domain-containing protein
VRDMLGAYVRMGLEHPNAYRLVFCSPPRGGEGRVRDATAEIGEQCYARYVGVIREIAAEGRLRVGDADSAARVLWAACHGLVALAITRPNVDWGPAEALTNVLLEGLLHGLVADQVVCQADAGSSGKTHITSSKVSRTPPQLA